MTRAELVAEYTVDEHGRITDNGKFEREMLYVPYFWHSSLEGGADEDHGALQGFHIEQGEMADWPELAKDGYSLNDTLWLYENEVGFVGILSDEQAQAIIAADDNDNDDDCGE